MRSLLGVPELTARQAIVGCVLAVALVSCAVLLFNMRYDHDRRHLESQTLTVARALAFQQADALNEARGDLQILVSQPQTLLGPDCARRLKLQLDSQAQYYQLGVADLQGRVRCSAVPPSTRANIGDRDYFVQAMASDGPILSDALFTRVSRRWTVTVAQRLTGSDGGPRGVIFASLDLDRAQDVVSSLGLPPGSIIGMTDSKGTVVARYPDPGKHVGHSMSDAERFMRSVGAANEQFIPALESDGVKRSLAYARIPGTELFVHVGIPHDAVSATRFEVLRAGLILLAGVLAAALGLCWLRSRGMLFAPSGPTPRAQAAGPPVPAAALTPQPRGPTPPPPRLSGEAPLRLLLVEDDPVDAELTVRELRRSGMEFEFERVDSPEKLAAALERGGWSVVISDYNLAGGFDGFQALALVRGRDQDLPFIMVSGTIGEDVAVHSMKAGAGDYVMKGNLVRLASAILREVREAGSRRERNRAQAMHELEHAITRSLAQAEDVGSGLQGVLRAFCETEGWSCGRYFALDQASSLLRYAEGWCVDEPGPRDYIASSAGLTFPDGTSIAGEVSQSGRPLWIADVTRDPRTASHNRAVQAGLLGVFLFPVVFEGRTQGVVSFNSREIREPDERLLRAFEVIGAQLGQFVVRKEQQLRIARLSRLYAVLSGINSAIVRIRVRGELFREACRVAAESGGFRLAWVGTVDLQTTDITPAAWNGTGEDYIGLIPMGPGVEKSVPRLAMQERRPRVINDMREHPHPALREQGLARGFRSLCVLPLLESDRVVALLTLYAGETGFFNEEEMKLLEELAGDISFALDTIAKEERLNYLAYYDPLTSLANRTLFLDRLGKELHSAARDKERLVVLFLDVDRFKSVNESLGRQSGDALLKELARRLKARLRDADDVARVSADHFAVLLHGVQTESDIARVVESLLHAALDAPFALGGQELRASAKVGISVYPGDGEEAEALFRNAESAAQQAKEEGEKYLFYTRAMSERIAGKLALENRLRLALERDEFVLHYQPKVDLRSGRIVGAEALIRWMDPDKGLVPPGQFIPLLEETGLILQVGDWALRRAVRDHGEWLARGLRAPRVAVNVSPVQLRQRNFVETVSSAIAGGGQPPGVDLEITESLIMQDIAANIAKLEAVRDLGLGIAIDDFGTGYSSLSYLARLPVEVLKIDRSFVVGTDADADARTLVATIIDLAHSLRLAVVAEGVETEAQAQFLRGRGCDQMQGFLFSRPVPAEAFVELLLAGT